MTASPSDAEFTCNDYYHDACPCLGDARAEVARLRKTLQAAREILDYIDGHGCDDDSREAEKGWKAIDTALLSNGDPT